MRGIRRFLILTLLLGTIAFATSPTCAQGTTEAYFEFRVSPHPEKFIFKLTNPTRIQEARDILTTGSQKIVAGTIGNLRWRCTTHFPRLRRTAVERSAELMRAEVAARNGKLALPRLASSFILKT
jgi:hypothetical protein